MKTPVAPATATFEEIVKIIDEGHYGFVAIVDSDNKLLGIVTDSDVRKAVIEHRLDLESVINRNPVTINIKTPRKMALQVLRETRRMHMPLVDDANRLIDVISLSDVEFNIKPNSVVIMAGGLGSRLGDLTREVPKPMLALGNKPILESIIRFLNEQGFISIFLSVNYKSEVIKNHFKDGSEFGVRIHYIEEHKRMGTAGSLSLLPPSAVFPILVMNGDILTTTDFSALLDFHIREAADATMCVREVVNEIPYGVVDVQDGAIVALREKPRHSYLINGGMYVLNPSAVNLLTRGDHLDMTTLFERAIQNKLRTRAFQVHEYWLDVGRVEDYKKAEGDIGKLGV